LKPPRSCCMATSWAAAFCVAIRSATASAWERSILPFRKARRVNSPGWAMRAPLLISRRIISACMNGEPWQLISAVSSPV
jgi:hypothetical protein